jgi:hypothetical protein
VVEPIWKGATELIICLARARMHNVIVVQFSDGYMDAVIIRDFPKADLIALLLKVSDGSYVKSTYDTYLNVIYLLSLQKYINVEFSKECFGLVVA